MNNNEFSNSLQNVLKLAKKQALKVGDKYVDLAHMFYAMVSIQDSNVYKILLSIGCDINSLKREINQDYFSHQNISNDFSRTHIPLSQNSDFILRRSIKEAKKSHSKSTD